MVALSRDSNSRARCCQRLCSFCQVFFPTVFIQTIFQGSATILFFGKTVFAINFTSHSSLTFQTSAPSRPSSIVLKFIKRSCSVLHFFSLSYVVAPRAMMREEWGMIGAQQAELIYLLKWKGTWMD